MIIEINEKIMKIINDMPYNKTVKKNAMKIYGALYLMSKRKNKNGYFSVPSTYLSSINKRYYRIIKYFEEAKLIKPYTRPVFDDNDIFKVIDKRYYDVNKGICMKYKFLISTGGENINVDLATNKTMKWFQLIQNSLLEYGYEYANIWIKRDTFGRRVHHTGIMNYKEDFSSASLPLGEQYYTIDSISSQPRLLWLDMKKKGIVDPLMDYIFMNEKDFYLEVQHKLNIKERNDAKELFMYWINSKGYVTNFDIHLIFPVASKYIKDYKSNNYKNLSSHLQRIESKIWIDDILNNVDCEWALPVHDSLIVKEKDVESVYSFIKERYPELRFKKQIIK
jgi:hypothetical protein